MAAIDCKADTLRPPEAKPEARWQLLQKRTFTRYINSKLASRGLEVEDLYEDLKDGRVLYNFLEVLTGSSLRKYGKLNKGKMRIQQVANLSVVFKSFPDLDIKLENIGVTDVVDGSPTPVLGWVFASYTHVKGFHRLVWSIIAFYLVLDLGDKDDLGAVKKKVLKWARRRAGSLKPVADLTSSFADGAAFLAILHDVDPAGSPFEPAADALENYARAFGEAEAKYGLPRAPARFLGARRGRESSRVLDARRGQDISSLVR